MEKEDQISFRYFAAIVFGIRRGRMPLSRVILAGLGCDSKIYDLSKPCTNKVSPNNDDQEEEEEEKKGSELSIVPISSEN